MKSAVDILYEQYYFQNALEQEKDPILSNYRAILRRELTKRQRKFLLQFEDRFGLLLEQQYLPDALKNRTYYHFGDNKTEQAAKAYWERVKGKKLE